MSLGSWRVALRLARRDALRARGRSLLVIAMVALPVAGVSAADIVARSSAPTVAQREDRALGGAQASIAPVTPGRPLAQTPDDTTSGDLSDGAASPAPAPTAGPASVPTDPVALLRSVLPAGARLIPHDSTARQATTASGQDTVTLEGLPLGDPVSRGITTLVRGRVPGAADETVATSAFLRDSGLSVGSVTRLLAPGGASGTGAQGGSGGTPLRIVGEVEYPGDLRRSALVVSPSAFAALSVASGTEGAPDVDTVYLVTLPGGAPFTWAEVMRANRAGFTVNSRAVQLSPPPDSEVPFYRATPRGDFVTTGGGAATTAELVVAMALAEIVLLAGPAFAVGARRSRRQLGLLAAAGGSRAHVRRVVLAGGAVLGAVGAVTGLLVATVAVALARGPIEEHTGARFVGIVLRPLDLAGIVLIGLATGLLAAMAPAIQAGRQAVVAALTGQTGTRPPAVWITVVGALAATGGVVLALLSSARLDASDGIAAGSVVAELGLVLCTPFLVGQFGRIGRWLPPGPRLALRDATRHRGRTAPAVSAVMAAVAGAVAMLVYATSLDAQARSDYTPSMPRGGVELLDPDSQDFGTLARQAAAVEGAIPGLGTRAQERRLGFGADCGQRATARLQQCGNVELTVPPAQRCPTGGAAATDPRCRPVRMSRAGRPLVEGDAATLRAFTGSRDPAAVRALAEGRVVVTDPRLLDHGQVTLSVTLMPLVGATGQDVVPDAKEVRLPGVAVRVPVDGVQAVVPDAAVRSAGLTAYPLGFAWLPDHVPSAAERQRAAAGVGHFTQSASLTVERGFQPQYSALVLGLLGSATLVAVAAAGIATGLAAADAQGDLATLAAVGAAPSLRRRLSGFQCAVIAAMGALLGLTGIVPAAAVWQNRATVTSSEGGVLMGSGGLPVPPDASGPLAVPWMPLALLVIGLPLLAWVSAALVTRSRTVLVRRTD
ncbi:FtsX-like permease family protein [Streptacidiphilus rugosus]|uniref:FtsX-like permease family protein n=1 Tax=Streptacidiphilus rugosus TaxID=405783 RepID=UPI0005675E26|nr:FtsX-like permease family protein [Streptacidiphilus rugosus]